MIQFLKDTVRHPPDRSRAPSCGPGTAELLLLHRVWGLCLSLRVSLRGPCPPGGGRPRP